MYSNWDFWFENTPSGNPGFSGEEAESPHGISQPFDFPADAANVENLSIIFPLFFIPPFSLLLSITCRISIKQIFLSQCLHFSLSTHKQCILSRLRTTALL
jgi:hypothetical protein